MHFDEFDDLMEARQKDRSYFIGPSGADGCYRRQAYEYHKVPASDDTSLDAAHLGTLLHQGWSALLKAGHDPAERRPDVEVAIPGLPRTGEADDVDFKNKIVTDLKGLALDTPLPTPTGWTTMGNVQVGDFLVDMDGSPVRVTAVSDPKEKDCVWVLPRGGEPVLADLEHRWLTRISKNHGDWVEKTTQQMFGSKWYRQIPTAGAMDLPEMDLPLDPWVLGYWLGNGSKGSSSLTSSVEDRFHVEEMISSAGYSFKTRVDQHSASIYVHGIRKIMAELGILGEKFIPPQYLRASARQRLGLLRGLMDSDGTWNKPRRRAKFDSTDESLRDQVYDLIQSLGQHGNKESHLSTGFGLTVMSYGIEFVPQGINPFAMGRKAQLVDSERAKDHSSHWRISFGKQTRAVTRCVTVDSPSSTYLAGRSMIVTHNSAKDTVYQSWLNRGGPYASYWDQVNLYAYGLADEYGGDWTLRILAFNRETGQHCWYEQPADPERAEVVIRRIAERHESLIASASLAASRVDPLPSVENFPREGKGPGSFPCDWCPFISICWPDAQEGMTPQSTSIADDPDGIGRYAMEYVQARNEESKFKTIKADSAAFLKGLDGDYTGPDGGIYRVSMAGGSAKDVPDCDAMVDILLERDLPIPMKTEFRAKYLKVNRKKV